jgi:hypothetical protein
MLLDAVHSIPVVSAAHYRPMQPSSSWQLHMAVWPVACSFETLACGGGLQQQVSCCLEASRQRYHVQLQQLLMIIHAGLVCWASAPEHVLHERLGIAVLSCMYEAGGAFCFRPLVHVPVAW